MQAVGIMKGSSTIHAAVQSIKWNLRAKHRPLPATLAEAGYSHFSNPVHLAEPAASVRDSIHRAKLYVRKRTATNRIRSLAPVYPEGT